LLRLNEPTASEPTVCWEPAKVQMPVALLLADIPVVYAAPDGVPDLPDPEIWMEHPVTMVLEVPELVSVTVQMSLGEVHVQDVTCAETCAELVNDPNRPNTNPAMAMAAMRVMAMSMTVASTGEMAFLFLR